MLESECSFFHLLEGCYTCNWAYNWGKFMFHEKNDQNIPQEHPCIPWKEPPSIPSITISIQLKTSILRPSITIKNLHFFQQISPIPSHLPSHLPATRTPWGASSASNQLRERSPRDDRRDDRRSPWKEGGLIDGSIFSKRHYGIL